MKNKSYLSLNLNLLAFFLSMIVIWMFSLVTLMILSFYEIYATTLTSAIFFYWGAIAAFGTIFTARGV